VRGCRETDRTRADDGNRFRFAHDILPLNRKYRN
jgi:hypothetical protein